MIDWDSLDLTQRFLIGAALRAQPIAGSIQALGEVRRWSGVRDAAALRSYTEDEERAIAPEVAGAAVALVKAGVLLVRDQRNVGRFEVGPVMAVSDACAVLADGERWLCTASTGRDFVMAIPDAGCESLMDRAWPVADTSGLPSWDELSREEKEVLVCAAEFSGYFTGPFGIWTDPPAGLSESERLAWIDQQLAPLVPFVRKGWIEVRHMPDAKSSAYSVVPFDRLRDAFCDPALRYEGDEWGVGFTCVFTLAGYSVWRGGWSEAWFRRLNFD